MRTFTRALNLLPNPLVLLLALLLALPAQAELVVFVDGGLLDVEGYAVDGDRVHLHLPNRGRMSVSILRIERILEDAPAKISAPAPVDFDLRFSDEHPVPHSPYGEMIYEAARRHGLNPGLIAAVAVAESSYNPEAVSIKGAQGLMQLMPATAERFGLAPGEAFEPEAGLDVGARYLRWLADRFEDRLDFVLAGYNAGEGAVDRYAGVPPYRETRNYLRRIYAQLGLGEPPEDTSSVAE